MQGWVQQAGVAIGTVTLLALSTLPLTMVAPGCAVGRAAGLRGISGANCCVKAPIGLLSFLVGMAWPATDPAGAAAVP